MNRRYILNGGKPGELLEKYILDARHERTQRMEHVKRLVFKHLPEVQKEKPK